VRGHVWNLRSRRCFSVIARAFAAVRARGGMRLVHFSVQGNHIHLLIEAANNDVLARGVQGLSIRIAKSLNRLMGRRGAVFEDHYHSRVLRTPTEAARALAYVLGNFDHHAAQWGRSVGDREADPFSSAAHRAAETPLVSEPRTWLLSVGWFRGAPTGAATRVLA